MGASISTATIDSCSDFLFKLDDTLNQTTTNAEKFNVSYDLVNENSIEISHIHNSKIFASIEQEIDVSIGFNFMSTLNDIVTANNNIKQNVKALASTAGEVLKEDLSFLDNFAQIKGSSSTITSSSEYKSEIKNSTVLTSIFETVITQSAKVSGKNKVLITDLSDSEVNLTSKQKLAQKALTEIGKTISKELTKTLGVDIVSNLSSSTDGLVKNSSTTWIIVAIVAVVIVIVVVIIAPVLKDLAKKKSQKSNSVSSDNKVSTTNEVATNNEVASNNQVSTNN